MTHLPTRTVWVMRYLIRGCIKLTVRIQQGQNCYFLTVTSGEIEKQYQFCSTPPEGQSLKQYLENCKKEALLLAELELPPDTEDFPEINLDEM